MSVAKRKPHAHMLGSVGIRRAGLFPLQWGGCSSEWGESRRCQQKEGTKGPGEQRQ